MDGERLTAPQVEQVSKWPSRTEQLSILLGQILSPGAMLASQLNSVGGALASQIEQKGEGGEPEAEQRRRRSGAAEAAPAEAARRSGTEPKWHRTDGHRINRRPIDRKLRTENCRLAVCHVQSNP